MKGEERVAQNLLFMVRRRIPRNVVNIFISPTHYGRAGLHYSHNIINTQTIINIP